MQEPIDHTISKDNNTLSDYRPDESTLLSFRRMGRLGIAIGIMYLPVIAYDVYIATTYWNLYNRINAFRIPSHFNTEYLIRFCFAVALSILSFVSLVLLLRASRSLLQYGSETYNMNLGRPVKHLYTWFICLLVGITVNAAFYIYLFIRLGAFSGIQQ